MLARNGTIVHFWPTNLYFHGFSVYKLYGTVSTLLCVQRTQLKVHV